jgi:ATP-dependent exoDNAse (exonuclease V) beta subunit
MTVPIEPRHICILFRRFLHFGDDVTRPYVDALEARGVPHLLVGGKSFHDREEVDTMRAALAAVEWPDDELSVFATLRGPLFALGDDALLVWRERQGRLRLRREMPPLSPPETEVADALAVLRDLHLKRNRRPIAETVSRLLDATRAHAGIAIRNAGEQALANVLRVLELARRFEAAGASSFRAFVDRLDAEAERGEAAEAPVVEEGTEGVRIMSVHRAKGLEFPVVILCDPCAPAAPKNPSRLVDPARRVWAMPLAGCAPIELLADRDALLQRDREEVTRVAYVAATRARDVLVVPAFGDDEPKGWLEPLNPAIYPAPSERRLGRPAPGCPPFAKETVLDRPPGLLAPLSMSPGLHAPQAGTHEVVWWDAQEKALDREIEGGVRSHDLLREDGVARPTAESHARWQERRARSLETGAAPTLRIETATARSKAAADGPSDVALDAVARDAARPRGRRFGTLVHAVLAAIDLRAGRDAIERAAAAQGRIAGAPPEEIAAAAAAVAAALQHPLLQAAARAEEVRREEPVVHRLADGTLLEGVVDLAFRDADGWTVVDFKTQGSDREAYGAQVHLYCAAVEAATGLRARGVLLAV